MEVSMEFMLKRDTLALAAAMVDRFLSLEKPTTAVARARLIEK